MHVRVAARWRTAPARFWFRRIGMIGMGAGVVLVVRARTSVARGYTRFDRRVGGGGRGDDDHVLDRPRWRRGARGAAGGEGDEDESEGAKHVWFYACPRPLLP